MALNSIGGQTQNLTIFRPTPSNTLQKDLAQFYERTSDFVNEKFKELAEGQEIETPKRQIRNRPNDDGEPSTPRLQPLGMGTMVDLLI